MPKLQQRHEIRAETRLLTIRLSELLELDEKGYRDYVSGIERDPLFKLLRRPAEGKPVIRRQPWPQTRWSPPEPGAEAVAGFEGEAPPEDVVALIQRVGQEAFERYFLYNEGETSEAEACRACSVTPEEGRRLFDWLDGALAHDAAPIRPAPAAATAVVAAFERSSTGITLAFFSPHYARGLYRIDYDEVERLKRSGAVAKTDLKRLRELLGKLETVNSKQTVLAGLLRLALDRQAAFLKSGDPVELETATQLDAAIKLGVAPSSVSRALAGRAVRLPWGGERVLSDLFPSQRDVAVEYVKASLMKDPGLKDRELWERLKKGRGIEVTVRSVNLYRRKAGG